MRHRRSALLFVLAVFEFGRAFVAIELVDEGARLGCRLGIIGGTASQQVKDAVINYLPGGGLNGESLDGIIN
jgi:hypothetical protein